MTKGEEASYNKISSTLSHLISMVKYYCQDYDCGSELLRECKKAEENIMEARMLFNKGKRKKQ